ncbi:MAG: lipopolysaccharide biosynthesis protein [Novosphingobium sp.]
MSAGRVRPQPKSPLARIFANTAWLLGGKGFGAVCGIAYLAILTRTLGLKDFGHFSLIFGTAQALIAIAGFQTWRVVVRYGSEHVHAEDWDKFGRLGMLSGMIDLLGAVLGCVIAGVTIYGFGDVLDINPDYVDMAFYFNCAMVFALVSAPTGIVRALHRFDMAVYVEAVVPIGRLAAAVAIWMTGPSVGRFLFAWAVIDLLESACYWIMARKLCPQAVRLSHLRDWRQAIAENPGVDRFFLVTYAASTLEAVMRYGPLLAVGALIGTRAAGLYRLAGQLTQAMSKLSGLLTRAVYAEVARVRVASAMAEFRKLAVQTSLIAGLAGAGVVILALLTGKQLLSLIGGEAFERGAVILVPLAIAASFDLASVAFEPVLHSTGRARQALFARLLAVGALGIGLWAFLDIGPSGAAWAVALGGAVSYIAMGVLAYLALRRSAHEETQGRT